MESTSVLPYRTDQPTLVEWLESRARGRSAEELRGAASSPKTMEGTAAAAAALGFADPASGDLTGSGERFALGGPAERRLLLREAIIRYAPYGEMLRALEQRGCPVETEVRWVEAWWATQRYGSSESNRREGAAAFGRLLDAAALGEYVPGRRGRPTRIRWAREALGWQVAVVPAGSGSTTEPVPDLFAVLDDATPPPERDLPRRAPAPRHATTATTAATADHPSALRSPGRNGGGASPAAPPPASIPVNRITLPLDGDRTVRMEVPLRLPAREKRRLLDLLDLLITED